MIGDTYPTKENTMAIFLVRVSYLVPVVATTALDAEQLVLENMEDCAHIELSQALDSILDPMTADPAHALASSVVTEQQVEAGDLADEDFAAAWADCVPWGDDDDLSIEERLTDDVVAYDEEEEVETFDNEDM